MVSICHKENDRINLETIRKQVNVRSESVAKLNYTHNKNKEQIKQQFHRHELNNTELVLRYA